MSLNMLRISSSGKRPDRLRCFRDRATHFSTYKKVLPKGLAVIIIVKLSILDNHKISAFVRITSLFPNTWKDVLLGLKGLKQKDNQPLG